jgi:hypothetical protein
MGMPLAPQLDPDLAAALKDEPQVWVVTLHNTHHPVGFQLIQAGRQVMLPKSVAERLLAQGAIRKLTPEERASAGLSSPKKGKEGEEE